ncbi:COesterase domain-containing protein [Trichonephila clavipes]|uniref:COesterase domain-containing protein n=1 Tax=Trichonephila clavipes TaxID=2585209 RepID=A0A8X6SXP6_TRICX|nr:COesterase domain-containing protein [Trichonephila clavipes]
MVPKSLLTTGVYLTHYYDEFHGPRFDTVGQGIAYATPPIGTRRWRKPVPLWVDSAWCDEHQTQEAFTFGSKCFQLNPYTKLYEGSEDCLFLNVWTPSLDMSVRPVDSFPYYSSEEVPFRGYKLPRGEKRGYRLMTTILAELQLINNTRAFGLI